MRTQLAAIEEVRATFTGTFVRLGTKRGWEGATLQTVLLLHVRDMRGIEVCDHLWMNCTKGIAALQLQPGDVVQFDARVKAYAKGYQGRREDVYKPYELDYKLSHPTKVVKAMPQTDVAQTVLVLEVSQ